MTPRRQHHARETTRNERFYLVQMTRYSAPRTSAEFRTSDKRQAFAKARDAARTGTLTRFVEHLGGGRWKDHTTSVTAEVAAK